MILCARETQASISDSVHRLLKEQIELLKLSALYRVHQNYIECPRRGSEFIFAGIRNDPNKIKSMEGVTRRRVSEAAKVSEESWKILKNTIRREGSEC